MLSRQVGNFEMIWTWLGSCGQVHAIFSLMAIRARIAPQHLSMAMKMVRTRPQVKPDPVVVMLLLLLMQTL